MLSPLLSILILASVATCSEVLYLHFTNLHPSRLPEGLWPRIYAEIMHPISGELPSFEDFFGPPPDTNRFTKAIGWLSCLFALGELRGFVVSGPKDSDSSFKPGQ